MVEQEFTTTGFHKGPMGFLIDLENGWTVSVQFGIGSYCNNRSSVGNPFTDIPDFVECPNAEIAAWPTASRVGSTGISKEEWYVFEDGAQVKGWQKPTEVLAFMNMISYKEHWLNEIDGGEYLSECCNSKSIDVLDDGEFYRVGTCSQCLSNSVFTKESDVRFGQTRV